MKTKRPTQTIQLVTAVAALALSGCAITQNVKPIDSVPVDEVCIVVDPTVRPGFLNTYLLTLTGKGYKVRQLALPLDTQACPVVSTYVGKWSWDLALYLSFAEIVVYRDGKEAGRATYDSTQGGANMSKFIKGEEKIGELVNALYPARPGR